MNTSRKQRVCHYCGQRKPTTWDHIVPRALGGRGLLANRVRACHECNNAKADSWPICTCRGCERARELFATQNPIAHARYEAIRLGRIA